MDCRRLQFFFAAFFSWIAVGLATDLEQSGPYQVNLDDLDRRHFSLADGRATLLTVVTQPTEAKAQHVGHTVPDEFLGDPQYRFVTVINFRKQIPAFLHGIITAIARGRFHAEADAVQPRYAARKIEHSPRADLFAVADFDGSVARQLGMNPDADDFAVFVFDGRGTLIREWHDVPSPAELSDALTAARPQ